MRTSKGSGSALKIAKDIKELVRSEGGELQPRKDQLLRELGVEHPAKVSSSLDTMVRAYFFFKRIGVRDMRKVMRLSSLLGHSTESMQEHVDFLREIGVANIGKVVEKLPAVLEYDIESMRAHVAFLREIGVVDIGRVVERVPSVLGSSIESMRAHVDFLREEGMHDIGRVVERHPSLLEYSIESMWRKIEYFIGNAHLTIEDLESTPSLISLSMHRITARWEYFRKEAPAHYEEFERGRLFFMTDPNYIKLVKRFSAEANQDDYASFALSLTQEAIAA